MDALTQAKKALAMKKPKFYLFVNLVDIRCASFAYPSMKWRWTREKPPIYILWEDNYKPHIYEIYEKFINALHFAIFKKNAPRIFENSLLLIATMGYWYTM